LIIYLDESGDLGFDFSEKSPSKYLVITLLVCDNKEAINTFKVAVKRTLKNKLNRKKSKRAVAELHAAKTSLPIKQYFYRQIKKTNWKIYTVALNKKRVYPNLTNKQGKKRLYNYLANFIIDKVDFNDAQDVTLVVDKCKNKKEIQDFNNYVKTQLEAKLPLEIALNIYHEDSRNNAGLQAVDAFCWGILESMNIMIVNGIPALISK
jgi:uncharacterized protein (DUF2267 family)